MATETGDSTTTAEETAETTEEFDPYLRGVTVTTTATLLGMGAAVLSTMFATTSGEPDNFMGMMFLLAAIVIQFPLYRLIGIDVSDFGTKDQLYIFFMTFVLWFVSWSILLTTGALQ